MGCRIRITLVARVRREGSRRLMLIYPVMLDPAEEGGFVVTFPDVPEAITQGDNKKDALMMAQDALVTMFDAYMQDRQTIPEASPVYGQTCVSFPVILAGKIALYNAMLAVGMNTDDPKSGS